MKKNSMNKNCNIIYKAQKLRELSKKFNKHVDM